MIDKTVLLQFIKFGIVGLSNTTLSYVIYSICILSGIHYLIANVIGFIGGVLNAFYWSNRYVFKKRDDEQRNIILALIKTFLAYGSTGLVFNSILLYILVEQCGMSDLVAQLIGLTVTVPLNFIINKYWSFNSIKNYE